MPARINTARAVFVACGEYTFLTLAYSHNKAEAFPRILSPIVDPSRRLPSSVIVSKKGRIPSPCFFVKTWWFLITMMEYVDEESISLAMSMSSVSWMRGPPGLFVQYRFDL